jgi:hypothetical protein
LILLIPVVLFLIDCGALVICQVSNDALAKHAARAAAEMPTNPVGLQYNAASAVVSNFAAGNANLCSTATLKKFLAANNTVSVQTEVICKLPCPIPLGGPATQTFDAMAVEPVVGDPP